MPEHESKSPHVDNGKAVQSLNPKQSAWLTHWAGMRSESSTHDHLAKFSESRNDHDIKKHQSGVQIASDNFEPSKGVSDVDLALSLKKPGGSKSFPFFKLGQERGKSSISNKKGETSGVLSLEPQVSHKKFTTALNVETPSRDGHFLPEAVSEIPTENVKYHMFFGESSHSCSRPSKEKFTGPENFHHLTATFASKEQLPNTYCSHTAGLVHNENGNEFHKHEKSEMPSYFRHKNTAILETGPSTSSNHSPVIVEDQYRRMQKHIGMAFFPHQIGSPDTIRTVQPGSCSFHNVPHFIHNVETTRMCAPLGSVEGLAGGLHSFSRTTHSLLITKQTDVKVYQDNQIFRESRVSTQLKGGAGELNFSCPHFAHGERGVKLQLLDSSDHESQENVEDVRPGGDVQMDESSADAVAKDMELFKENNLSGTFLSLQNKDIMVESNLALGPPSVAMPAEKEKRRKRKIELPDMNLDISVLPAASSSTDKAEPCPSRTQSLDINTLQFNIDHTNNSKSDECSDSNMGPELGSRWIKRLKLNHSSSLSHGGKTSKLAEASFHGKLNRFFTRDVEANSEPEFNKFHGKKSESLMGKQHQNGSEMHIGECSVKEQQTLSSVETKREVKDITLSHSWIRRWRHNKGEINPKTIETSKPENPEPPPPPPPPPPPLEEFQKKQFPSIAAMALMGKAMTGYHQCKFQKKEAFVTWNTKTFD